MGILFFGGISIVALFWASPNGISWTLDSARYLDGAEHILRGEGYGTRFQNFINPIPVRDFIREMQSPAGLRLNRDMNFPPMYPYWLAALRGIGLTQVQAVNWSVILFFGLNGILFGWVLKKVLNDSLPGVWVGVFCFLASESMLQIHTIAASEPLFIFLEMAGFLGLAAFIERPRWGMLTVGSLALGAAFLTRYLGIAVILTGILGLWIGAPLDRRRRLRVCLYSAAISFLPMGIFLLQKLRETGQATSHHPTVDLANLRSIVLLIETISSWIFPHVSRLNAYPFLRMIVVPLALIVLIGLAVITTRSVVRKFFKKQPGLPSEHGAELRLFFGLFIPLYLLILLPSVWFVDPETPFDIRLLSPIFVSFLVLAWCAFAEMMSSKPARGRTIWIRGGVSLYLLCWGLSGIVWVAAYQVRGREYNNLEWRRNEIRQPMRDLLREDERLPILTNDDGAIYFFTRRYSYWMNFSKWENRLDLLKEEIGESDVLLVFFKMPGRNRYDREIYGCSYNDVAPQLKTVLQPRILVDNELITVMRSERRLSLGAPREEGGERRSGD
ncbi:MAG: hypothetical protein NTW38_03845 [Candidatus Aminicenantes bacterium]|nr:hypothetical protein [Candidatus Aminicenantes bacterium]